MVDRNLILHIDTPEPATLRLVLRNAAGHELDRSDTPLTGHVDNILLTAVDKLLKRNSMDRFALEAVEAGLGIDKNSTLCRIVSSFAAAIAATPAESR